MRRCGRGEDQNFDQQETLYHRVTAETLRIRDDGGLFVNFRVPDTSCNRSKHGGAWDDVLLCDYPKHLDGGVISFAVADVPARHDRQNALSMFCQVWHDPLE